MSVFCLGVWIQVDICMCRLRYRPEESIGFPAACVTDRSELPLGLDTVLQSSRRAAGAQVFLMSL